MTGDQHVVPVADRYPPGHDDRAAVAKAVLEIVDRTRSTIIAGEPAVLTEFTATKTGQLLVAIHDAPGPEPIDVTGIHRRQAANRYRVEVEA